MVTETTRADYTILHQYKPSSVAIPAFCQPGFFFNEPAHLHQQLDGRFHLISALNQRTGLADARCAFFIRSDGAVSPGAAPFGSIEFSETLPEAVLDDLLRSLTEVARVAGASTLRLVNYPHCYAPGQAERLVTKLHRHDFQLLSANQTFFMPVSDRSFDRTIVPAERRRLRKCQDAGFRFEPLQTSARNDAVAFVAETRRQQGYPLPISTDQLANLLSTFPDQFLTFGVYDGFILAAVMITVRVHEDILYGFLPASNPSYRAFSPMVMLLDGVFAYCQKQRIRLLDLGVSLDSAQQPKPSLMRFKRNLGAQESPKLVFEKRL